MATCKNCIGYKYCSRGRNGKTNFCGEITACNNVEILCNDFKNKADVAEVKHGEWVDRDGKTWCSLCDASNKQYKPPYCPHCGAKMDGGKG